MEDFEVGQVVQLRCGSPDMVVTDVRLDGMVSVAWTDDNDEPHRLTLNPACFMKV